MIWGHDPPRTHEKITGKRNLFVRLFFIERFLATSLIHAHNNTSPFSGYARKEEKMATINNMKKTLGERIREQRTLMQMTQEELAEELCVKKSTVSMYENDKVDIKGSILIELSKVLNTSPNYLLGQEDSDEDLMELVSIYKSLKNPKIRQIALAQIRELSSI